MIAGRGHLKAHRVERFDGGLVLLDRRNVGAAAHRVAVGRDDRVAWVLRLDLLDLVGEVRDSFEVPVEVGERCDGDGLRTVVVRDRGCGRYRGEGQRACGGQACGGKQRAERERAHEQSSRVVTREREAPRGYAGNFAPRGGHGNGLVNECSLLDLQG